MFWQQLTPGTKHTESNSLQDDGPGSHLFCWQRNGLYQVNDGPGSHLGIKRASFTKTGTDRICLQRRLFLLTTSASSLVWNWHVFGTRLDGACQMSSTVERLRQCCRWTFSTDGHDACDHQGVKVEFCQKGISSTGAARARPQPTPAASCSKDAVRTVPGSKLSIAHFNPFLGVEPSSCKYKSPAVWVTSGWRFSSCSCNNICMDHSIRKENAQLPCPEWAKEPPTKTKKTCVKN